MEGGMKLSWAFLCGRDDRKDFNTMLPYLLITAMLTTVTCFGAMADLTEGSIAEARKAMARGDTESALRSAMRAIEIGPKNAESYEIRALVYDERREYDKAIADYTRV